MPQDPANGRSDASQMTPETTPTRRVGDPRCGSRETSSGPPCGEPATWHIAWRLAQPASFSLACGKHMAEAQGKFVFEDRHRVEVACDMPGTGWLREHPSRCILPPEETDRPFLSASKSAAR